MTAYTLPMFDAIAVIYTIFTALGFLVQAWMNIFIPYTMNAAAPIGRLSVDARRTALTGQDDAEIRRMRTIREIEGIKMSVFGTFSMTLGMAILFVVTIGVTYANELAQLNAGMYVTTAAGAACIFAALGGWRFLHAPSGRPFAEGVPVWKIPFVTCKHFVPQHRALAYTAVMSLLKGVYRYPEAFKWLLAYTIYNDSFAAYGLVSSEPTLPSSRDPLINRHAVQQCGSTFCPRIHRIQHYRLRRHPHHRPYIRLPLPPHSTHFASMVDRGILRNLLHGDLDDDRYEQQFSRGIQAPRRVLPVPDCGQCGGYDFDEHF